MITEDVKAQMREIVARYPEKRSGMLPCLHLAQQTEGFITPEGMQAVAEAVGTKVDEVDSIVSFYSMYYRKPVGRHVIKVCTSISCYLHGSDNLLEHLEHKLGIKRGETTPDGQFTLQGVECLAACGMAPVLQVNNEFVDNMTLEKADNLVEQLARGEGIGAFASKWDLSRVTAAGNGKAAGTGDNREKAE